MPSFNRTYGIELEFIMPSGVSRASLARDISAAGVPCREETLNHRVPSMWKTTTDRSVDGGSIRECELVSPILSGEAGFKEIETVCSVLTQRRVQPTTNCGFHAHIDARRPTPMELPALKRLALMYSENEPLFDAVQPKSRRGADAGNGFCHSLARVKRELIEDAPSVDDLATVLRFGRMPTSPRENASYRAHFYDPRRYLKLNITPTFPDKHGTVEFRQHSGTTDPVKIRHWVTMAQGLVETAINPGAAVAAAAVEAAPTQARRVRPGTLHEKINLMLLRPEGVNLREVIDATRSPELPEGWKAINIPRHGKTYGIEVWSRKEYDPVAGRRVLRYFGRIASTAAIVAPAAPRIAKPASVAELCQFVGLDEATTNYFVGRERLFAQQR